MSTIQVVSVFLCVSLFTTRTYADIVKIDDGKIEGTFMISRLGRSFQAYLGIPFAEPPIGDLRFKDPQPVKPWNGTRDGTVYGTMCLQPNPRKDFVFSEDCLQLNVFTTSLTASMPVIVFIHGGSFVTGSGIDQGGPQNFMDRDVVVVSINYRLGALGFLATRTAEVPGNAGLKDQVLALRWVKKNIAKFGGNPKKITIAGHSAGSISVTAQMVSPMSQNLFHRVIAISGAIAFDFKLKNDNLEFVQKIADELECKRETIDNMISCLRSKSALDIISVNAKTYPECEVIPFPFLPVTELDFGQERFFSEDPSELLKSGNFSKVPIIIGRTEHEIISTVRAILGSPRLEYLNTNFEDMAPYCFFYEQRTTKSKELSQALRQRYFPFDTIDVRSFTALNNILGDGIIGYPAHRFARLASNFTNVFYYKFNYIGRFSIFNYPHKKPYGVHHVDDLQYSFYLNRGWPLIKKTDPENFMVERMTKIFENFANTGNPNYDRNDLNWPRYTQADEFYLDIGLNAVEKNGMFLERYAIWDSVGSEANELNELNDINFNFVSVLQI